MKGRGVWRTIRRAGLAAAMLLALVLAAGCGTPGSGSAGASPAALAAAPRAAPPGGWKTSVEEDQPLVGRIWDAAHGRFLSEDELVARLAAPRFVLLGEAHDNPDHHLLEALVIRRLVAAGRRPAVAFEMLKPDQAPALARVLARPDATPGELRRAVGWDRSGWPAWPLYEPVFAAVLDAHLPIVTANLSDRTLALLLDHGVGALDAATRTRLGLDHPLPPDERRAMADEIRAAHCGYAPEDALPGMVDVQRARDGAMAAALEGAARRPGADGAVLVAGNGHVRRDRAVPWHLRVAGVPAGAIASLAFLEVPVGEVAVTDPARDLEERVGSARAFDYVWYTPRVDAVDPCELFRQKLEKLRHLKPSPGGGD